MYILYGIFYLSFCLLLKFAQSQYTLFLTQFEAYKNVQLNRTNILYLPRNSVCCPTVRCVAAAFAAANQFCLQLNLTVLCVCALPQDAYALFTCHIRHKLPKVFAHLRHTHTHTHSRAHTHPPLTHNSNIFGVKFVSLSFIPFIQQATRVQPGSTFAWLVLALFLLFFVCCYCYCFFLSLQGAR